MKAWGLVLGIAIMMAACSTGGGAGPPSALDRYGGPPQRDWESFDRAGLDVISGAISSGRQPDGNTVVLASDAGLIVFDTGRHADHVQKIVDLAQARGQPVAAIINSHWHLDHVSGNIPLRKMWPGAVVYSHSGALTDALGGFLARGREANLKRLADPETSAALAEDLRGDIATVEQGGALLPTVAIASRRTLDIGGRRLDLRTAAAASAGDIWLYDATTQTLAAGDIVTLPAPLMDTACPSLWRAALDEILHAPFRTLIPGHGRAMTRAEVQLYSDAFDAFVACGAGEAPVADCATAWTATVQPLLDPATGDAAKAQAYATYYVGNVLRPRAFRADCPD